MAKKWPGLRSLLMLLLVMLITSEATRAETEFPVFSDGFEALETPVLDCLRENYPCSLADADPDALDRTIVLLQDMWNVRHAGTMEDVRAYLETQPDVVAIGGNYRYISVRVEGMMPAIFDDVTTVLGEMPASKVQAEGQHFGAVRSLKREDQVSVGRTVRIGHTHSQRLGSLEREISTVNGSYPTTNRDRNSNSKTGKDVSRPHEVVGEDSNGDGKVDQKDIKRAFVLAPYEWQFAPNDESGDLATRLETLDPYAGNVVFKSNPNKNDDNVTLEDWLAFDNYDMIVASTHGSRNCEILPDLSNRCEVWISSGIVFDFLNRPQISQFGLAITLTYNDADKQTPTTGRLSILLDFWRNFYGGTLEKKLVTFSACETGNFEGGALAAAMGGNDFVMGGWTEVVPTSVAFRTMLAFYEELATGLATRDAFDNIADLGLFPALNSKGILTSFEVFSPRDDDVRIIELPRLMHDGSTMYDGTNIQEYFTGTVGDQSPDSLQLTLQVDGVTAASKPEFEVRYRIDDKDVPGTFNLNTATLVDNNYRYEVVHDIPLGFPLMGGEVPIEVIVDLPEGGDSRFSVNAFLAGCYFTANVSGDEAEFGDRAAFFDGPAQLEILDDGAVKISLRNRGAINGDPSTAVSASFSTGPSNPLVPGDYGIAFAQLNFAAAPGYNVAYYPGDESADCPSCGGSVTIKTYEEEQSMAGSASVTMVRINPPPGDGELPEVTLNVDFVAAFGSQSNASSPYAQCSIFYGD